MKTSREPRCPDEPRWILYERVVMEHSHQLGFDISSAIERVQQQATRAGIQGKRHPIHREVATAKVLNDCGRTNNWRFAGLFVTLGSGRADFCADPTGQGEVEDLQIIVGAPNDCPGTLKFFLQFERIALYGKVEVADRKAADDVSYGAARQVDVHAGIARKIGRASC